MDKDVLIAMNRMARLYSERLAEGQVLCEDEAMCYFATLNALKEHAKCLEAALRKHRLEELENEPTDDRNEPPPQAAA